MIFGATSLVAVFGLVNMNYYSIEHPYPTLNDTATFFYASFDVAAWAFCVGWLILMCTVGLAGQLTHYLSIFS